jgi:anti-sigma B factor antagonist
VRIRPSDRSSTILALRTDLKLDVARTGYLSVVSARGEIDIATAGRAEAALDAARGATVLVLDLRGVEFIDTSGLRLIIQERRRAEADGYRFAVVRGPHNVQRLLEIAGFPCEDSLFVEDPAELTDGAGP